MWTYKGLDVYPAGLNGSGIRWYARSPWGILRADSKASMRELVTETMTRNGVTRFNYGRKEGE
jgi:hypothetical protein